MNTTRFARYFALPIVSAGIIGGAALGLAGTASAANTDVNPPDDRRDARRQGAPGARGDAGLALAPRDLPRRGPAAGLHPLTGQPPRPSRGIRGRPRCVGAQYANRCGVPPD